MIHPSNEYGYDTPRQLLEPLALAWLAIFVEDILCLKSNLEQLSHSMSFANIASLAAAKDCCYGTNLVN